MNLEEPRGGLSFGRNVEAWFYPDNTSLLGQHSQVRVMKSCLLEFDRANYTAVGFEVFLYPVPCLLLHNEPLDRIDHRNC